MRRTTATPADLARRAGGGRIPSQPGPRGAGNLTEVDAVTQDGHRHPGPAVTPDGPAGPGPTVVSDARTGPGTAAAPAGPTDPRSAAAPARPTDPGSVIPGAGPVGPEQPTVRLRETGPDEPPRYAPEWLQLREGADASARALDLLDPLRIRLANLPGRTGGAVVHDLGCGTGSMGRWLAPRLDGAQHWVLHDRDPYLLHFAAVASPRAAADGSRVTVETRRGDVARLTPDALAGASLVTASALLDVLTREEVGTLAAACAGAGCPALLTLSVAGRVELAPADPLDEEIAAAFNAHQRRDGLLGPDAVTVAAEAFADRGATVKIQPSPWRLGPAEAALTAQWLRGWVGAAVEQRPELAARAERYLAARLAACAAGDLHVTVHHSDLLALPRPTGGHR
ncbi:trans-aconitate methyltransferase [Streptomyces longwoodensis]|uniref:Trans-aconitate methyltransferase n=1 Tax=Streptomyces lasalocidi TaxID=324833 RepID=A0A4U5WNT2_STRLS|nr:trans-aconitate methyltransferase [Streptomyces lasalocidi]